MKIACLSGKGGAGKTFVAANLAAAAGKCTYIDCDVEEPNGHLFFKPEILERQTVETLLPGINANRCDGCRKCVDFCKFNAMVFLKGQPMIFPEICHSCGGCSLVCPHAAITEKPKPVGMVEVGQHGDVTVVSGFLNMGEASGVPIIHHALRLADGLTIIDCPPGSACPVMESIMDADYCVLVAEPTAFGFHNFQMVYQLARLLGRKCGVVINKETEQYPPLEIFCRAHHLEILDRIPYTSALAQRIAQGELVAERVPAERLRFSNLLQKIGVLA